MIKQIIPRYCPNCESELIIKHGKGDDVLKLMCNNDKCEGSLIKKLIKGISILELKDIGPSTIEKLYSVGLRNVVDLFDKDIINKKVLIESKEFKEGKQLDNIFDSIDNIKEIRLDKMILSLQIQVEKESDEGYISIGAALSTEIAKMMSDLEYSFEGLSIQIREEFLDKENSKTYNTILNSIKIFEDNGIKIKKLEKKKIKEKKKITKKVSFDTNEDISELVNIGWEEVDVEESDMLVVDNKNQISEKIDIANKKGIKIMTFKQIKLLFL
jgi:NAD-dependent DNA ligase